jgi:hypothetical protein
LDWETGIVIAALNQQLDFIFCAPYYFAFCSIKLAAFPINLSVFIRLRKAI